MVKWKYQGVASGKWKYPVHGGQKGYSPNQNLDTIAGR